MTAQQHADHLLAVWQQRRNLKPIYRLVDCPPLNDNTSLTTLARQQESVSAALNAEAL